MPRLDPGEAIEAADIVGVVGDSVTKRTAAADQVLVVSDQSIVTGNSPGADPADREGYEPCAFVGQVPVKICGTVEEGNIVVPSGENDGVGRAIEPSAYRPGDGPIVGRAWENDDSAGITEVTVAVGLETGEALAPAFADQQETIEELDVEIDALRDEVTDLEAEVEHTVDRIVDLETENQRKDTRINDLKQRLAALEDLVAGLASDYGAAAPADD